MKMMNRISYLFILTTIMALQAGTIAHGSDKNKNAMLDPLKSWFDMPEVKAVQELSDDSLIARVRKCRPADLSDGMDALGLVDRGTMTHEMRPIRPGIRFAGFAYTVKLVPAKTPVKVCQNPEDYFKELDHWVFDIVYVYEKDFTSEGGEKDDRVKDLVCVIDMSSVKAGTWGSNNSIAKKHKGLAGTVVDGTVRDTYEANLEGINAFCTKRSFNHPYGRVQYGGHNIPITCGGVQVNPGDIISADDDGVLVIPREVIAPVLHMAEMILKKDQRERSAEYKKYGIEPDDTLGDFKKDAYSDEK